MKKEAAFNRLREDQLAHLLKNGYYCQFVFSVHIHILVIKRVVS